MSNFYQRPLALCLIWLIWLCSARPGLAQCGNTGCNSNTFLNAGDPNTIVYDNIVSTFHSSIAKKEDGTVWVWGENADAPGFLPELSPMQVIPANGYNYTGNILLFSAGSIGQYGGDGTGTQFTLLTTAGLYAWGSQGAVYDGTVSAVFGQPVKNTNGFGLLIPRGGNTPNNGLPAGVMPNDVKMLFSTGFATAIVTCSGNVWVLSRAAAASYGDNTATASANFLTQNTWHRVQQSAVPAGNPLSNVVAVRGASGGNFVALKSDGTVWTWGQTAYLGNGTSMAVRPYAQQMTLPAGVTPKMIGMTNQAGYPGLTSGSSYYLLGTNGNVYSLGRNENRQLGDLTTTERTSWVQVQGPTNVVWISPQEHDGLSVPAINALTADGKLWAWGDNNGGMLAATATGPTNPFTPPQGVLSTDLIGAVETGGHTSVIIKQCETKFGYTGHRIHGSMGNGDDANAFQPNYTFETVVMPICASGITPEIATAENTFVCNGFTLTSSSPGTTNQWSILSGNATVDATSGVLTLTGPGPIRVLYGGPGCEAPDTVTLLQRDFGNLDPVKWPIASATTLAANSAWLGTDFPTTDCATSTTDPADGLVITGAAGSGTQASPWQLTIGQAYPFNLTVNGNGTAKPVYWAVWYDTNGDGDFTDADDYFNTGNTSHGSPVAVPTFNVTVPASAGTDGAIRVASTATNTTFTKAMNGTVALTNGEIEDFFVTQAAIPPVATNDSSTGNAPGSAVTQNILANDTLSNGAVATAANTTVALNTTGLPAGSTVSADGHTVTVPGEGTWVYDPATGNLTFTPLATFTGDPTPVPYTLTETATGLSDTATASVAYNTPPVATNDSSTGNAPGSAVTQNILANDTLSNGAVATAANTTVALNTTGLPAGSTVSADGHTVTVPGEGTWVYDPATGNLTFTPLATFTGNPTPVPYTLTETATGLSDTATASVAYNTPPVATNDSSTGNAPGSAVTQNILANDTLSNGAVATAANTTVALNTTGLPAGSTVSADGHTVTVPGEGTWVYDPATGNLTFTPLATFTGDPTPVPYTLTETATGLSDTATASVAYNTPPVATNDSSTGNAPGTAVTQNILANDTLSNGAVATAANTTVALNTTGLPAGSTVSADGHTVTVPGEGTWVYDPATGNLTFTPLATFTGDPTPVPYTLTETATGLSDTATASVAYNTPPVATNDSSTGNAPGTAVTQNILANDTLSNGAVATAANTTVALNTTGLPAGSTVSADGHTVTVPGEGTWVYDPATGNLTFTPLATFTGDPTPVPYTLTETATGLSDTATASVAYNTPPVATNDSSTGNAPGTAVTQNILANDTLSNGSAATAANTTVALNTTGLPAGSTVSADGHTVTVPGEGTWVYDPATGNLTFTPLATFTGDPTPVPYTLTETATGLSDTATASVAYNTPPVATNDSSTGNAPGSAVTQNILANDTLSNGAGATAANTTVALNTTGLPAGSTVSADGHTVTVPDEGTWVYDPATGELTFTPLATFTGNPTPVPYTLTETATGLSDNATVTVTYDQDVVFDYGDFPYTGAAVNYPKVNAQFKDADNNHIPDDTGAIWLGQIIDAETDGFTNPATPADYAKGDDNTGVADEDGLKVDGGMVPGTKKWVVTANSNGPATVHYGMWIDWGTPTAGPDGTFDAFYSGSIATASPANDTVTVTIPATFQKGSLVNVRLIASTAPLDQATGFSTNIINGEIEDYQMTYEAALPVRLVSFQASENENDAVLTWKAADQVNFDRYEIERSDNGKQFSLVGTTLSNNLKDGDYHFTDKGAASAAATLYYRLKMVDTDGTYAYSSIRAVTFQDSPAINASAWPTLIAAGQTVNVSLSGHKGPYQVTMFSTGGRQILQRKIKAAAGPIQLPTQGLPLGTYLIKVNAGGWQKSLKIVIVE